MTSCVVANSATMTQYGTVAKSASGQIEVQFSQPYFTSPPVVILTPYWADQSNQVTNIETLTGVTTSSFTLSSKNANTATYSVNWIAIGQ